ncbi:MAG: chloramphenicol acetyltransferase [Methanobacteriaceae archaeon]|jgi:chloramphenicol O-acetyltransferase type A|nr:chloramphenicol acetyltransferase [Methanobacteriaceae archaeon]
MKEVDFNLEKSPFKDFLSSRYSMTSKIDVSKTWNFAKENNLSFFILSLGCLTNALNSIPEMKRRIINGKVIEFDKLDAITPILNEKEEMLEMRVLPPESYDSIKTWHDYVINLKESILKDEKLSFSIPMSKRDSEPIANFSCIPWVDFDSLTTCISYSQQIQPLITWGKVNADGKMSVAITVNHIFIFGKQLGEFYKNLERNFNSPKKILKCLYY